MDQAVGPPFLEVEVGLSMAGGNWGRCPFVVIRQLLQTWDTASGLRVILCYCNSPHGAMALFKILSYEEGTKRSHEGKPNPQNS